MNTSDKKSVKIRQQYSAYSVRHPIDAAKLIYSMPKFVLRGPIYLIFIICITALLYSFWAKKDILVVAPLTLDRNSVTIEAIGGGQVVEVVAEENMSIMVGDIFLKVQEQTRAAIATEQETFESKILKLNDEKDKLLDESEHRLNQLQMDLEDYTKNKGKSIQDVKADINNLKTKIKTANREKKLRKKEYNKANKEYKRILDRYNQRKATNRQKNASEELKDRRYDSLADAKALIDQLNISIVTAERKLETLMDLHGLQKLKKEMRQTEARRDRDLKKYNDRIHAMQNKINKSQKLVEGVTYRDNLTEYKCTFDGLVTMLHVKKGEIISPGTPLVTYIRGSANLEAMVFIHNKDIGKIKRKQRVKIKYYAFPYQEFGIPEGTIYSVAKRPSQIKGHETKYLVKVALDKETISDDSHEQSLDIGLEGIAEIKTGEKRLIELVFRPISRFFKNEEEG